MPKVAVGLRPIKRDLQFPTNQCLRTPWKMGVPIILFFPLMSFPWANPSACACFCGSLSQRDASCFAVKQHRPAKRNAMQLLLDLALYQDLPGTLTWLCIRRSQIILLSFFHPTKLILVQNMPFCLGNRKKGPKHKPGRGRDMLCSQAPRSASTYKSRRC